MSPHFPCSYSWARYCLHSLFLSFLHHCPVLPCVTPQREVLVTQIFRSLSEVFCWELTQTRAFCLDFHCCVIAPVSRLCFIMLLSQSCFITSCPTSSFQLVFAACHVFLCHFPLKHLFPFCDFWALMLLHETTTKSFLRLHHPFCCFCSISWEVWAGFLTKYIVQVFNSTYFFSAEYLKETLPFQSPSSLPCCMSR